MTPETLAALRKAFPAEVVGKLPRLTCKACSNAPSRVCSEHIKKRCPVCENYISERHVDLDYVGHASVTDRLLTVDPGWCWEPMAVDQFGAPALDKDGNLWIRLTVCGVTRPGCGDGPNMKERIGDALRNAAMRFGVALELWSKEELESHLSEGAGTGGGAVDAQESPLNTGGVHGGDMSAPARPCPLCGFDLTGEPVKKQDGAYVHKQCPNGSTGDATGLHQSSPSQGSVPGSKNPTQEPAVDGPASVGSPAVEQAGRASRQSARPGQEAGSAQQAGGVVRTSTPGTPPAPSVVEREDPPTSGSDSSGGGESSPPEGEAASATSDLPSDDARHEYRKNEEPFVDKEAGKQQVAKIREKLPKDAA